MSAGASSYNDAVAGLYRLLLEPEAVIDLVSALDSLAQGEPADGVLDELRAQFAVAENLSARIRPTVNLRTVEYALLRRDGRIASLEDATHLFATLCDSVAIGHTFRFQDSAAQSELAQILATIGTGEQRFMLVDRSEAEPPLTIAVVAAPDAANSTAAFMIAAPQPLAWSPSLEKAFQGFDLTTAELRVLRAMRADQSALDLAQKLSVSDHTVRTQIKSILAKVGMSRQGEVVRFREDAMRLSAVVKEQMQLALRDAERRNPTVFPSGRPRPSRLVTALPSGRHISYREFGDPTGKPVLVLHGAHSGSMIPEGFKPAAEKLGLRLIAPDRPGFGASSPTNPNLEIKDAARETLQLLTQLRVRSYHVLALASGCATALELASNNAGATDLTLCSAHFGSANAALGAGFGFFLRQHMMRRAPWLLEQGSRFMWHNMTRAKLISIVHALVRKSPADLEAVERNGLLDYFGDVVMDALQSPPDGHIWEVRALDRYKIDLTRVRAPVTLLFGKDDPITDADGVSALFSNLPNLTRETFDGGQIFFYEAWPEILQRFAKRS